MTIAGIARAIGIDRLPFVGARLRQAGRFLNNWRYGDAGVPARVDGTVDVRLSPLAFSGGAYSFDPDLTRELRMLADPNRDFLDVGAHVGIASLLYSEFTQGKARIAAFEPNPNVLPLLRENSRVNGMSYEAYGMALGDRVGMTSFFVDGNDPNASLSAEAPGQYWFWQDMAKPVMTRCTVPISTIDAFCSENGFRPGLIKLDVEGAELQALRGATEVLRQHRPLILLETHVFAWKSFGHGREDLERTIADAGYAVFDKVGNPFSGPLGSGPDRDNNHFILRPT